MAEEDTRGRVFALTGGIGSGKSTVAGIFRTSGVPVVDADQLARDVVRPGTPGLSDIIDEFGEDILLPDGNLDRQRLGKKIFGNDMARLRLNAIVHPRVKEAAQAAFARELSSGYALVCCEIPLLFETGQEDRFRPVVLVTTPVSEQVRRICTRDGLTEEDAKSRLAAQMSLPEKAKRADIVINNDSDLAILKLRAKEALQEVRRQVGGE